jgi:hypothetical protein
MTKTAKFMVASLAIAAVVGLAAGDVFAWGCYPCMPGPVVCAPVVVLQPPPLFCPPPPLFCAPAPICYPAKRLRVWKPRCW